jgi:hypothetical protein
MSPFYHFAINIPKNKFAEAKRWLLSRIEILSVEEKDQFFLKCEMLTPSIFMIPREILLNLQLATIWIMNPERNLLLTPC